MKAKNTLKTVYLAFGGNLGKQRHFFGKAIDFLLTFKIYLTKTSQLYSSPSFINNDEYDLNENFFINSVIEVETCVGKEELFEICQTFERVSLLKSNADEK